MRYTYILILGVSLSLNAIWLVNRQISSQDVASEMDASTSPPPVSRNQKAGAQTQPDERSTPREYYEQLLSSGLTIEQTKPLLFQWLERKTIIAARLPQYSYWRSGDSFQVRYALARVEAESSVRSILVELYGSAAKQDPVFAKIFRPLDPVFAFMSSDEQLQVERAGLEHQLSLTQALESRDASAELSLPTTSIPPEIQQLNDAYHAKLAQILGEEGLFEYSLRESAQARQLRSSGITFSEPQFREAYRALQRLGTNPPDPDTLLAVRDDLRNILGDEAFTTLWLSRDPRFASVRKIVADHGLQKSTLQSIYAIMNDAQDQLIASVAAGATDPVKAMQDAQEAQARREQRLTSLVGEDVANDILKGLALNSLGFSQAMNDRRVPKPRATGPIYR